MNDRIRLAITGVVAVLAVGATLGSGSFDFDFGDDDKPVAQTNMAQLKDFTGVSLIGPDRVIVTRGERFSVQAGGDERTLKRLKFFVQEGVLHVTRQPKKSWFGGNDFGGGTATIRVTLPALARVSLTGSGDISVDKLTGAYVRAAIAGSGDLSIAELDAENADLVLAGSGDLLATGHVRSASLNATGSGNIQAAKLDTERATLKLIGSGDIAVRATQHADVSINGSGDAHVTGTTACQVAKNGSGDADCKA